MGRINLVGTSNHFKVFGPNSRIDLNCTRDDARVIGCCSIEASAIYCDGTALHNVTLQIAIVDLYTARRNSGFACINKTCTININASRIGDYNLGA